MLVGSAEVELRPDASGFGRDAAGRLRDERGRFAAAGRDVGRSFGRAAGEEGGRGLGEGTRRSEGRLRGVFSGLGRGVGAVFGAAAAAAAGAGLAGLLISSIGAASDVSESTSKVKVVFGEASTSVLKFADNSATAFGQTKAQALEATGTYGNLLRSIGLTEKQSAKYSTTLVGLASDLASFNNTDVDTALEAIRSGLTGETEPLKQFGVNLNDATLQQKALDLGLTKGKGTLSASAKAQAAYALILEQTKLAQGDFSRTSGGLANQQRILGAQFGDLKATLGSELLPVATTVVSSLNSGMVPAFEAVRSRLPGVKAAFSGAFAGGASFLKPVIDGVKSFAADVVPAFAAAGAGIKTFVGGLLPTLREIGTQIVGVVGPALGQIGGIIRGQLIPAFLAVLPVVQPVARFLLQVIGSAVVGALKGAVNVIKGVLTIISGIFNVFAGIFTGNWSKAWEGIKQIFSGAFRTLLGAIQIFLNIGVLRLFRVGITGIRALFTGGWSAIKSIWSSGLSAVASLARSVFTGILALIRGAVTGYIGVWRGGLSFLASAARSGLSTVVGLFRGLPGQVVSALSSLGSSLYGVGQNIIRSMASGIRSVADEIARAAVSVVTDAIGAAKRALHIGSPSRVFAEMGRQTGAGYAIGLDGSRTSVAAAGKRMVAAGIAASAVTAAGLVTGAARATLPSAVPSSAAAAAAAGPTTVRVYIGDRELTDIVRVEIDDSLDDLARAATGRRGE